MDIEFDPSKAKQNWRKHGVHLSDAEQCLRDPIALTIEDPDADEEQRFVTIGVDAVGRLLVVVHTPRGSTIRIISARKAGRSEVEKYDA